MPKIPILKAKDVLKYLIKYGCIDKDITGSHHRIYNPKNKCSSSIPVHSGEDLKKYLLPKILKDLGIDVNEFLEFMKKH